MHIIGFFTSIKVGKLYQMIETNNFGSKSIENVCHLTGLFFIIFIDPRIDQYPLTSSPMLIILLTAVYVYFVTSWGQRFMKSRPPFEIDSIIQVYNLFQICINLFIGTYVSKFISCAPFEIAKASWRPSTGLPNGNDTIFSFS